MTPKGPPWWRPFARRRWRRALALPVDLPRRIAFQVGADAAALGLKVVGDCSASELVLPGGWIVPQMFEYRTVEPEVGAILGAAARMLEEIARKLGAGRIWTYPNLEIVHPVYDDGTLVRLDVKKQPHVLLRAVYCHERAAVRP